MATKKLDSYALWRLVYKSDEYKKWKREVRRKCHYECQHCGISKKQKPRIRLESHHIKPKAQFLHLIFQVSNGILLCKPCHIKEHKAMQKDPEAYNYDNQSLYQLVSTLTFTRYRRRKPRYRRKK